MSSVIGITVGTPLNPEKIKKESIEPIEKKVSLMDKVVANTEDKVSLTEKRVTNLEAAVYGDLAQMVVDDSVAYTKDVPQNVVTAEDGLSRARVDMVGGMTRKCSNLLGGEALANKIKAENPSATINTGNKTIAYYASSMKDKTFWTGFKPNTQYTFVVKGTASAKYLNLGFRYTDGTVDYFRFAENDALTTAAFVSASTKSISALEGAYLDGAVTLYYDECGIFEGALTVNDFEPYFDGLRSAKVEAVESVGANVLDDASITLGPRWDINADGYIVPTSNGMFRATTPMKLKPNTTYVVGSANSTLGNWAVWFTDENYKALGRTDGWINPNATFTTPSFDCYAYFTGWYNATEYQNDIMINEGTTAQPYTPYVKHTLPIPAEVRAEEWYGLGINDTYNNHVKWEDDGSRTYTQMVKRIVLDGVTYGKKMDTTDVQSGGKSSYYAYLGLDTLPILSDAPVVWCGDVTVSTSTVLAVSVKNDILKLGDSPTPYEITAAINAHLNALYVAGKPVEIVYVPAGTPTTEDISDLVPADNMLPVQAGGTVTMANEYGYDVPSEIVFVVKEVTEA